MGQFPAFQGSPTLDIRNGIECRDRIVAADMSHHRSLLRHEARYTLSACDLLHLGVRFRSQRVHQRQSRRHFRSDSRVLSSLSGVRLGRLG